VAIIMNHKKKTVAVQISDCAGSSRIVFCQICVEPAESEF